MLQNDYLIRQIEVMARFIAGLIFKKDTTDYEFRRNEKGELTELSNFCLDLHLMIKNGDINEAEDMLFEKIEKNQNAELLEIAVDFYGRLNNLSDDFLDEHDFSRQEISQGMTDVQKLYGIEVPDMD